MKINKKEFKKILEEHIDIWCTQRGEQGETGCEALIELGTDLLDLFEGLDRSGHDREAAIAKTKLKEAGFEPTNLNKLLDETREVHDDE